MVSSSALQVSGLRAPFAVECPGLPLGVQRLGLQATEPQATWAMRFNVNNSAGFDHVW